MKRTRSILLTMMLLTTCLIANARQPFVEVYGTADFLHQGDTILFRLYRHPNTDQEPALQTELTQRATGKSFRFRIPCDNFPHYFNLRFKGHSGKGIYKYYAVPGQPLQLHFNQDGIDPEGSGTIAKVQAELIKAQQVTTTTEEDDADAALLVQHGNKKTLSLLHILEHYRERLPAYFYQFMKVDLMAINMSGKYSNVELISRRYADSTSNPYLERFLQTRDTVKSLLDAAVKQYPDAFYCESFLYTMLLKYRIDSCVIARKPYHIKEAYDYLKAKYKGKLREELLAYLILPLNDYPPELTDCIKDALTIVREEDYRTLLKAISETRVDGAKAFNFRLTDQKGEIHQLSDFRNKVVFIDFWFTGCGFCRVVAPYIRKLEERFKGQAVEFISISSDESKTQWEKSVSGGQYTAPENHNFFTEGKGNNHPALTSYRIREYPAFVLVDKNGLIHNVPVDPRDDDGRSAEAQIKALL
ncbi:TlpA family protein disulfide reductase [Mucilaginibacter rubeus]|uniref:TlpA family protein disulfide reductase n=1 Tax=Mucilaginibacter rubeus TaxID=2027860 RepID=A0A5C1I2A2_9SPHI|nr:TlpA disulfide reductase family protein [Mucilaginibacter rubeus]QEM12367.1 TlpA family protein disulfide reductase [Mucilaginibacter rubeus]